MRRLRRLTQACAQRLAARWDVGQPWPGAVMAAPSSPQVTPRKCGNCGQPMLRGVPVVGMPRDVIVWHCDECDIAHCPRCRAYCASTARFCTECCHPLRLDPAAKAPNDLAEMTPA